MIWKKKPKTLINKIPQAHIGVTGVFHGLEGTVSRVLVLADA